MQRSVGNTFTRFALSYKATIKLSEGTSLTTHVMHSNYFFLRINCEAENVRKKENHWNRSLYESPIMTKKITRNGLQSWVVCSYWRNIVLKHKNIVLCHFGFQVGTKTVCPQCNISINWYLYCIVFFLKLSIVILCMFFLIFSDT